MIEENLPAMACSNCNGSLVSLLYYRHWTETQRPAAAANEVSAAAIVDTTDTAMAMTCPKCQRIMTKYRLSGNVANRLDVCGRCDEVWLDAGEWELLESLQLNLKVAAVFTDKWQRRIRQENSEDARRRTMVRLMGEADTQRVEEFREWLSRHEHKSQIMAYLYRR
jgi:Zn-finger nucleic acid-binding protein